MLSIFLALWFAGIYHAVDVLMSLTATLSVTFAVILYFYLRHVWDEGHCHAGDKWDTEREERAHANWHPTYIKMRRIAIITSLISLLMPTTDVVKLAVYAHVGTKVYDIAKESNPEIGKLPASVTKLMTSWVDAKTREFEKELTVPADTTK